MSRSVRRLPPDHGWDATPGYRILVADRGAVQMEFPSDWQVEPGDDSIRIHDRPPPDDDCRLELSFRRLPPLDWERLDLGDLVRTVLAGALDEDGPDRELPEVREERRFDLRVAWATLSFDDDGRAAVSRVAVALGGNVQVLLTFDSWADHEDRLGPIWDNVLRSLKLGRVVKDPLRGRVIDPRTN